MVDKRYPKTVEIRMMEDKVLRKKAGL